MLQAFGPQGSGAFCISGLGDMAKRIGFSDDEVRAIRREEKFWRREVLAKRWDTTVLTIRKIINRETYGHVA